MTRYQDHSHPPSVRPAIESGVNFERIRELMAETPISSLHRIWGERPAYMDLRNIDVRAMTVEEAGELAALHGIKLPDILAV